MSGQRGRTPALPKGLQALGWIGAAAVVALSKFAPPRRQEPLGPPGGRLSDGLPAAPPDSVPVASPPAGTPAPAPPTAASPPAAAPPAASPPAPPPAPAPAAEPPKPGRLFARRDSAARAKVARPTASDWRRELPRPFAELRRTASPLIMPRLELPRVLAPNFVALRGLAARARPGEPVHVRLTAYCLQGRTAGGTRTRAGIVAADTRLFPLTRSVDLFAAGRYLGRFRVEDTGGAVRGPHIDIWTPDCADARRFGSRPGVASLARFGE